MFVHRASPAEVLSTKEQPSTFLLHKKQPGQSKQPRAFKEQPRVLQEHLVTNSAHHHQKDLQKTSAVVDVYSVDSLDSPPKTSRLEGPAKDRVHTNSQGLIPKKQLFEDVEVQARKLVVHKAPIKEVQEFLRRIPWHEFQRQDHGRTGENFKAKGQQQTPAYVHFGAFSHGGVVGITSTVRLFPWLTRLLLYVIGLKSPNASVTTIAVSCNKLSGVHRDKFNMQQSQNVVVPVTVPPEGGKLWIQSDSKLPSQKIQTRQCGSQTLVGQLHSIRKPLTFDPQKSHATEEWVGDRVVLLGYSLEGFYRMKEQEVRQLRVLGFPLPKRLPSKLRALRLRGVIPSSPACLQSTSIPQAQDASSGTVQGRPEEATPETGRGATRRVDQSSAVSSTGRASPRDRLIEKIQ